jgi:hypothetical protein
MALEKHIRDMEWYEVVLKILAVVIIVPIGAAIIAPFGQFAKSFATNGLQALFEGIWNL